MTSENKTKSTRRTIMNNFLRTLVWIDDEIRPIATTDEASRPFKTFFYPTAEVFQKKGILVHLHPYAPDPSVDDQDTFTDDSPKKDFDSALTLARKADIIILDWNLGRGDPQNSINLLKALRGESAIRYIVVLSQYTDQFEENMRQGGMLLTETSSQDVNYLFRKSQNAWINNLGTHIIVMSKSDFKPNNPDGFCNSVLDNVYNLMAQANPDYLHWTAIEIAAKLHHSIPEWLQGIPRGTDAAVLSELLSDKTEARDFIPEHLLEDLSHLAKIHILDSLTLENCQPENWINKPESFVNIGTSADATENPCDNFIQLKSDILGINRKDIKQIRSDSERSDYLEFVKSQMNFAQFCESMIKHIDENPAFGAVYKKTNQQQGEPPKIYICISQECDCSRSYNLLFLEGKKDVPGASKFGVTSLFFQGEEYKFCARSEKIQTFKIESNRSIRNMKKVGQLRKATAARILNRFWNHMSRPAVNLPTFVRVERAENHLQGNEDEDCN